ncbi:MAG: TIR domain-containing protein [Hyphomicrobiaceae bacterium]
MPEGDARNVFAEEGTLHNRPDGQARGWDFFISRASPDATDSSDIGGILEAAGYRVLVQEKDFANRSLLDLMNAGLVNGARVIALLSADYLVRDYCTAEWLGALDGDPLNKRRRLIVMRAAPCEPTGLLTLFGYYDLIPIAGNFGLLRDTVLAAVRDETIPAARAYWHAPAAIVHEEIRPLSAFTGRTAELAALDRTLWSNGSVAVTQAAAVQGLGGVGKSMLARHYAWEHRARYAGVWWLSAETASGVLEGLVRLGAILIPGLAAEKDQHEAAQRTLAFIEGAGFEKP